MRRAVSTPARAAALLVALTLMPAGLAGAQTQTRTGMTLEEAVEAAFQANPEVRRAREQAEAATQAKSSTVPVVVR